MVNTRKASTNLKSTQNLSTKLKTSIQEKPVSKTHSSEHKESINKSKINIKYVIENVYLGNTSIQNCHIDKNTRRQQITFITSVFTVSLYLLPFVFYEIIRTEQNQNISCYSFAFLLALTKALPNWLLLTLPVTNPKAFIHYWHDQELLSLLSLMKNWKCFLSFFIHFFPWFLCLQCSSYKNTMFLLNNENHKFTVKIFAIKFFKTTANLTINPLRANFTKWSNTLKQFVSNFRTNCFSVFDHFVGLALG